MNIQELLADAKKLFAGLHAAHQELEELEHPGIGTVTIARASVKNAVDMLERAAAEVQPEPFPAAAPAPAPTSA